MDLEQFEAVMNMMSLKQSGVGYLQLFIWLISLRDWA